MVRVLFRGDSHHFREFVEGKEKYRNVGAYSV